MSTLVDELLQDFEDSGSEAGEEQNDDDLRAGGDHDASYGLHANGGDMELDGDGDEDGDEDMGGVNGAAADEDPEDTKARVEKMQLKGVDDKIAFFQAQPPHEQAVNNVGNVEDHPEYNLLTQANSLSTSIDSEIVLVHKYIRDHYSIRFPELETLITNPLEYAKVVAIMGNGPMDSESVKAMQSSTNNPLNATLKSVVDGPSLMIVTIEATTTKGCEMSQEELSRTTRACQMVINLDKAKKTLTDYVQSRMNKFAPNLTALVGSLTAAQMLNVAGGLTGLSKTPACNVAAWGNSAKRSAALATNVGIRQQGYLFNSPIIRSVPGDLKKQALRIVSAKLVLAARVDRVHSSPDGSMGEELKQGCLDRLDKLQEKPLNKGQRALPVPDDKPSRKRGGRRARKAKEATAMTDLRKAQNRMAFGKEEKEVGYGGGDHTAGMGMIGQSNDGRVRGLQIDARTRAKLSQKSKGWGGASSLTGGAASSLKSFGQQPGSLDLRGKGLRLSGVGTTVGNGGTMSTLSFTPVQGLELVDPKKQAELKRKRDMEGSKWFNSGSFTQVGGSNSNGGFKRPDLPPSKKINTGSSK